MSLSSLGHVSRLLFEQEADVYFQNRVVIALLAMLLPIEDLVGPFRSYCWFLVLELAH